MRGVSQERSAFGQLGDAATNHPLDNVKISVGSDRHAVRAVELTRMEMFGSRQIGPALDLGCVCMVAQFCNDMILAIQNRYPGTQSGM